MLISMASRLRPPHHAVAFARLLAVGSTALLVNCGGSSNPFNNPGAVSNSAGASGQTLSYAYFQRCINPIFVAQLAIQVNGATVINTCAGAGCHANATGSGGAFRVVPTAQALDVTDPANTPDVIRASDMYKNFYSAQGEVLVSAPLQSRLIDKPLLLNVLHGGGRIFADQTDPNVQLMMYWINNPVPLGQDEFSSANYAMFTPPNPQTGSCNTQ
jgi:hypothetical protein